MAAAGLGLSGTAKDVLAGLTQVKAQPLESLDQIEHIVIFMQENRSFDSYFGSLSGVRGFDDPTAMQLPNGRSVFHQPTQNGSYVLPFRQNTQDMAGDAAYDVTHNWETQHAAWNNGRMDGFITGKTKFDHKYAPYSMGYFTRADIPFYYALADAFTICDGYHCSALAGTNPNRIYMWSATLDPSGGLGGPAITNADIVYRWTTYPERLQEAGIDWHVYQATDNYGDNSLIYFESYRNALPGSPLYERALAQNGLQEFGEDVRNDSLPQVSWIVAPKWWCEHPPFPPGMGMPTTAYFLQALQQNPDVFAKTLFILTYDENDGYFDHVAPPTPPPGTPGEFVGDEPIGLGFRVPTIVVSPWSQGGWVVGDTFDHTSLIQLIEKRFGVTEPNITQWRRDTCGDLTATLDLATPNTTYPTLPPTFGQAARTVRNTSTQPMVQIPQLRDMQMPTQERQPARRRRSQ